MKLYFIILIDFLTAEKSWQVLCFLISKNNFRFSILTAFTRVNYINSCVEGNENIYK